MECSQDETSERHHRVRCIESSNPSHFFRRSAEMPGIEGALRDLEVRDHAVFQRTNRNDISRRAPEHPLRLIAHRQHPARPRLHCHDRRLAQNDPVIFYINERVRRAQVDPDVI